MLPLLIILFTLMPIIEITVLLQVGEALGGWNTIILVIITAIVGASLVRSQGLQTMFRVQQRMARGEMPGREMVEGLLLVVAGVLLVTPGFVTDVLGLLLVTPLTRNIMADRLLKRMVVKAVNMGTATGYEEPGHSPYEPRNPSQPQSKPRTGNVYEGEYISKDDK